MRERVSNNLPDPFEICKIGQNIDIRWVSRDERIFAYPSCYCGPYYPYTDVESRVFLPRYKGSWLACKPVRSKIILIPLSCQYIQFSTTFLCIHLSRIREEVRPVQHWLASVWYNFILPSAGIGTQTSKNIGFLKSPRYLLLSHMFFMDTIGRKSAS